MKDGLEGRSSKWRKYWRTEKGFIKCKKATGERKLGEDKGRK